MNTDKVKRIEVIDDEGRQYYSRSNHNEVELSLQDNDTTLKVIIRKFESAERKAEKLGFKIGDKCWDIKYHTYKGIITGIHEYSGFLCATFDYELNKNGHTLDSITNKVAIHCPTKEEYEFTQQILNINGSWDNCTCKVYINLIKTPGIAINISIYDYCKAMNIKPLFTTKDGKVIYNPKQICYGIYGKNDHIYYSAFPAECVKHLNVVFSTEEAAKDYIKGLDLENKFNEWKEYNQEILCGFCENCIINRSRCDSKGNMCEGCSCEECEERYLDEDFTIEIYNKWKESSNPILFYTEDFKDGFFPAKSCENCNVDKRQNCPICVRAGQLVSHKDKWEGKLEGEAIKKGDKCWKVGIFNGTNVYKYDTWSGDDNNYFKYFSNEKNARDYYNELVEKNKPKFEVGKWYSTISKNVFILYKEIYSPGFIYGIWDSEIFTKDFENWELADIDIVQEMLMKEAKRRFPIGVKVKDLDNNSIRKIETFERIIANNWITPYRLIVSTDTHYGITVYNKGRWAEILEETKESYKFDIGDIVKSKIGSTPFTIHNRFDIDENKPWYTVKDGEGKQVCFKEQELILVHNR